MRPIGRRAFIDRQPVKANRSAPSARRGSDMRDSVEFIIMVTRKKRPAHRIVDAIGPGPVLNIGRHRAPGSAGDAVHAVIQRSVCTGHGRRRGTGIPHSSGQIMEPDGAKRRSGYSKDPHDQLRDPASTPMNPDIDRPIPLTKETRLLMRPQLLMKQPSATGPDCPQASPQIAKSRRYLLEISQLLKESYDAQYFVLCPCPRKKPAAGRKRYVGPNAGSGLVGN